MTAYGIFGDVDAPPKLVRAALSDFMEAHLRVTPKGDFSLTIGVRGDDLKIYDEILDWAQRNGVYTAVITPAATYKPYTEPSSLTVSASFMLDVVESLSHIDDGKILALVGDQTPRTDVLRALAKAKDNGTEIRDLAEAGLSLIRFKGDDPPHAPLEDTTTMPKKTKAAEEETAEYTFAELGEFADDDADTDTAEQAQALLTDAAAEAGINPDDYATWVEVADALEEAKAASADAEDEDEDEDVDEDETEDEIEDEGLTRESLVGKDIAEIKALAKAAGIEGYTKMRREALIKALLGEEAESPPAAPTPPAKKAAGAAKKQAASSPANNGDVGPGGSGITDVDVERIADAVVSKLAASLSAG